MKDIRNFFQPQNSPITTAATPSVSASTPLKSPAAKKLKSAHVPAASTALTETATATASTVTSGISYTPPSSKTSYAELCDVFTEIEATTKRILITDTLADFFYKLITTDKHSLKYAVYLCLNKICPDFEGKELGIGESFIMKAIEQSTGSRLADIKKDQTKKGDLGQVALDCKKSQKRIDHTFFAKPTASSSSTTTAFDVKTGISIEQVFSTLSEIAMISGNKSQSEKINKIVRILSNLSGTTQAPKYFIRSLEGKLRIGLAERTVLTAISRAFVLFSKNGMSGKTFKGKGKGGIKDLDRDFIKGDSILKSCFSQLPSYDLLIPALLEHGIFDLEKHCRLTPGIPLKPMLAHPTKSLGEVLDRFEGMNFTCEFKYDGERAQIHQFMEEDGTKKVMVFSRNSENLSMKYPDIPIQMLDVSLPTVTSYVLDCEAVAWDKDNEQILPFQVLQKRKRKDVKNEDVSVLVCCFAFDLLYLNGQAITNLPLSERRRLLKENFRETTQFKYAVCMDSKNIEDLQVFLDESIKGNCEGLMVKTLDVEATYEPSKRSRNWLKVKKDYLEGVGDTLDLLVIGGYYGRGKRTGVFGGYLLACYDEEGEEFQSICKIGTGFTEEDLKSQHTLLENHIIPKPLSNYSFSDVPNIKPDVWFDAKVLFEVKAADLSLSPVHKAGMGLSDPNRGISLRFPRFIKIRDDKGVYDATSAQQVKDMYEKQQSVISGNGNGNSGGGADDDFEY